MRGGDSWWQQTWQTEIKNAMWLREKIGEAVENPWWKLTFRGCQHFDKIVGKDAHFAADFSFPPALIGQFRADNCDYVVHLQLQFIVVLRGVGELHPAELPLRLGWQHGHCCRCSSTSCCSRSRNYGRRLRWSRCCCCCSCPALRCLLSCGGGDAGGRRRHCSAGWYCGCGCHIGHIGRLGRQRRCGHGGANCRWPFGGQNGRRLDMLHKVRWEDADFAAQTTAPPAFLDLNEKTEWSRIEWNEQTETKCTALRENTECSYKRQIYIYI